MEIELTRREYRLLLDLVYLARWVIAANDVGGEKSGPDHLMLVQKVLSYASDMGMGELVDADRRRNEYFATRKFEDGEVREFIDRYDDACFWDELISRLARRDLWADSESGDPEQMERDEFWKRVIALEEKYSEEFSTKGVERLHVVEVG